MAGVLIVNAQTNSSSIVSKRSVERLYYPNEPHFFRFFVPKFQRRAPLINRGYHLRMHIIDITLRNFLMSPAPKQKVVVNLGCGRQVTSSPCLPSSLFTLFAILSLRVASDTVGLQRCPAMAVYYPLPGLLSRGYIHRRGLPRLDAEEAPSGAQHP